MSGEIGLRIIIRKSISNFSKKIIAIFFVPKFQELTDSTSKQKIYRSSHKSLQKMVHEMMQVTLETFQSFFEQND